MGDSGGSALLVQMGLESGWRAVVRNVRLQGEVQIGAKLASP
jgi:hypothetical protein